jgi:hypothetical protein
MSHHSTNWPARLADWRRSGLSIAAWCRNHAVSYQTFLYWRRRLDDHLPEPTGIFVQLTTPAEPEPIALECNGVFVHVPAGFDPGLLRDILALLKGA